MLVFIAPQMGLNSSYMQNLNFEKIFQRNSLWNTFRPNKIFLTLGSEIKQNSNSDG